jgi:hypothetical protein
MLSTTRKLGITRILALVIVALAIAMVSTVRTHADTPPQLDLTVAPSIGGAADGVDIEGMNYADAVAALTAAADDPGSATLGVAPTGFPSVSTTGASLYVGSDSQHSIAIEGPTNLLGLSATMLVTATWDDDADTSPDTAVLFKFGSASLSDFTSFNTFPVSLTGSWLAVTEAAHTVDPSALPSGVTAFFDDGIADNDDSMALGSGVTFRGLVDTSGTVIGDAVDAIGMSSQVRIDGTLTTSAGSLMGRLPRASASPPRLVPAVPAAVSPTGSHRTVTGPSPSPPTAEGPSPPASPVAPTSRSVAAPTASTPPSASNTLVAKPASTLPPALPPSTTSSASPGSTSPPQASTFHTPLPMASPAASAQVST